MSILDNEPCLGAFGPDHQPALCERCAKADTLPNDDWCQACALTETLVDIARCGDEGYMCDRCTDREQAQHEWMRGLLSTLSEDDQRDIIDAGRGRLMRPR